MPKLDEELQAAEELKARNQQQRREQQQEEQAQTAANEQNSPQNRLKNFAKDAAKKQIKQAVKKRLIWATAPYWGTALLFILGIMFLIGIVVIAPPALCNAGGLTGLATEVAGSIATFSDFCGPFKIVSNPPSGGAGATETFGFDIVVTSAYRAGAIVAGTNRPSAHGRGEAVDIALRNPTVPEHSTDPRIAQLVQMAKSAGFTPVQGDTLDEYTKPTEGASAGHIHIEFNSYGDKTYCDNTVIKNPPTDLVAIPSSIPVSGASDPRLRPCMISAIQSLFSASTSP